MAKATWKNTLLAESDDIVIVEGNVYFPPDSLQKSYFLPSEHQTKCFWKGTASYYDIKVGDSINRNAAWYYAEPKEKAKQIQGYVAFWNGVIVEKD